MTENTPLITVIIPVYNMQKYIAECLDSIVNQTLKNIEILCIDDCSIDNSKDIIKKYSKNDSRIKYYCLNQNSGSGKARNFALEKAEGEFVIFIDPDDLYASTNSLKKLYNGAKENNVVACGGNLLAFQNDNINDKLPDIWSETKFKKSGMQDYKDYHYPSGYIRFIYQTSFLRENNLKFPDYKRRQDPIFFVKAMSLIEKFYAIDEIIYLYRINYKEINWDENALYEVLCGFEDSFKIYTEKNLRDHYARDYLDLTIFLRKVAHFSSDKLRNKANSILAKIPFDTFLTSKYNTSRKYKNIDQVPKEEATA